jgi:hypothetical protein
MRSPSDGKTHGDDTCQQTLFLRLDSDLPLQDAPTLSSLISVYLLSIQHKRSPLLSLNLNSGAGVDTDILTVQLDLPLPVPQRPQIVRIVPALRRAFLDYGVYDQFCEVADAARAALALEKSGVYLLGQLVQLTEERMLAYPFVDSAILAAMKSNLAKIDLCFGMRHPAWTRRMQSLVAVNL